MEHHADSLVFRDRLEGADRDVIRRLCESTDFFRPDEIEVAVELVQDSLDRGVASGYHFLLAHQAKAVLGYVCYGPIACTLGSWDLYWIVVDNAHRRQGVGGILLAAAVQRIITAGGRGVYVETSSQPKYLPTRAFYERHGFRREAVLADFYAPGDDKLIYVRKVIKK